MRNFHEQSVSALDFSPASSDSQTFISPLLPTLHLLADSSVPERSEERGGGATRRVLGGPTPTDQSEAGTLD